MKAYGEQLRYYNKNSVCSLANFYNLNFVQIIWELPLCRMLYFEIICVTIMYRNDELISKMSWVGCLLTNFSATRYMTVKRMGLSEIIKRTWLFSANKIKSSESGSKHPTQLIVELNSSSKSTHHYGTYLSDKTEVVCFSEWIPVANLEEFVRQIPTEKFYKGKWW